MAFIPVAVVLKLPEVKETLFDPKSRDDVPRPDRVRAPDVAVRFKAPAERVNPLEAVKRSSEVKAPPTSVVTPLWPIVIAEALVVPMEMVPSEVPPAPALITTFPPVRVPEIAVALPAARVKLPPVAPAALDSSPAAIVTFAPVPEPAVELPGLMPILVAAAAAAVVISGFWPPASVILPAVETFKSDEVKAKVPPELPIATLPEVEASVVPWVEVKVVNEPAAAVV